MMNPLAETYAPDPSDEELVARALAGQGEALEDLLRRHQRWLYNIALRMLQSAEDAEDATQESLMKIVTHLSTFRGESAFRTWAYRVAFRHVLDRKRSLPEQAVSGFGCYAAYLAGATDEEPPDLDAMPADKRLVVEEARLSCMLGMLLCLDREQRLVFVLGELFEVSDTVAAEVLELSRPRPTSTKSSTSRSTRWSAGAGVIPPVSSRSPRPTSSTSIRSSSVAWMGFPR